MAVMAVSCEYGRNPKGGYSGGVILHKRGSDKGGYSHQTAITAITVQVCLLLYSFFKG
jgi:hypothetical protein